MLIQEVGRIEDLGTIKKKKKKKEREILEVIEEWVTSPMGKNALKKVA